MKFPPSLLLSAMLAPSIHAHAAETLFQDDFKGRLGEGWSWRREQREAWRVTDLALEVRLEPGNIWGPANDAKNVLLRPAPDGSINEIEIAVKVETHPTAQYEQADLVWYYDDGHMVKSAAKSFCTESPSAPPKTTLPPKKLHKNKAEFHFFLEPSRTFKRQYGWNDRCKHMVSISDLEQSPQTFHLMNCKSFRLFAPAAILAFALLTSPNLRAQPAPPASLLRDAYVTLSLADHDYKGHRAAAMKEVEAAAKFFRMNVRGDGRAREKQGVSDDQLRLAKGTLEQARAGLRGRPLTHVDRAIRQINIALSVR